MKEERQTKVEVIHSADSNGEGMRSEESMDTPNLKQILKPMLYILAMAGNYSFSDINSQSGSSALLSKVYRFCILAVLVLSLMKLVAAIFYFPSSSMLFNFNLLGIGWTAFSLAISLVSLKSTSSKYGHYEKTFQFWNRKIVPEFQELNIKYPVAKMKRGVIYATAVTLCVSILNIVGIILKVLFATGFNYLYTAPFESSPQTLSVALTFTFFVGFTYYTPIVFAIIFSILLQEAFKTFNDLVTEVCSQQDSTETKTFQKLRLLHLNLSKLLNELDQDMGWFYAVFMLFSVSLSVFTLYQIMKSSLTTFDLIVFLFWLFCVSTSLGVTSIYAALVHETVSTLYYPINITVSQN